MTTAENVPTPTRVGERGEVLATVHTISGISRIPRAYVVIEDANDDGLLRVRFLNTDLGTFGWVKA